MSDVHRRTTGSAELDRIRAERKRIHASWRVPRREIKSSLQKQIPSWLLSKLPRIPAQKEPPLMERIAEAKKLRGTISEEKLHFIINAIYGSARDRGEYCIEPIRDCLPEIVASGEPSIVKIQTVVAEHFNLTRDEMLSVRQCPRITLPRQIAMYLAKIFIPHSLEYIGKRFGFDHAAITHAAQKIERIIAADAEFAGKIEMLRKAILE